MLPSLRNIVLMLLLDSKSLNYHSSDSIQQFHSDRTVSNLDAVNYNIYVVFVVEADEALHTRAFMCRIRVIPDHVFVLFVFNGQIEVPL